MIPVRAGEHNPQLVACLRSIEANFPHNRVWLVGHIPHWVSDEVGAIPLPQSGVGWLNVVLMLGRVAEHHEVTSQFTYFNDDFYVLKKVRTAQVLYDMPLADRARRLKGLSLGAYARGAEITLDMLRSHGYENPMNYDLHTPLPMDQQQIGEAVDLVMGYDRNFWPHLRSVYGAIAQLGGKQHQDVKVTSVSGMIPSNATYVSSSVRSFNGQLGRQLRAKFAKKSKFEK